MVAPAATAKTQSFLAAAIILCTLLAYFPAFTAGFVWDDDYHLTDSVVAKDGALYRIWCTTEMANYWPISWTSYWLEYQIWEFNPAGYHTVNILIHVASSLLLWRVLIQLRIPVPAVAALIFAVHPINVESVAWISQRRNVLSMFFYLAAIHCYLRFDSEQPRKKWYGLAIACFILAMLSKGSAVMLPVVLLMCLFWLRKTLSRQDLLRSVPFFGIAFVFGLVEIWFQYVRAIGDVHIRDDGFFARLAGAGWVVWFYLYKTVWPLELCFVYPRWEINASSLLAYLPGLLLIGLLWLCWSFRQNWGRSSIFALGYFIVILSPFLGFFTIFFMRYSYVADHYAYLSVIAPIALITSVAHICVQRWRNGAVVFKALSVAIVLSLGTLTWQRCSTFRDAETLWRDTLDKNPRSWLAHNDLGNLLWVQGHLDEATEHFLQAIEINPDFPETHFNYGGLLDEEGRTDEAIDQLLEAIRLKPEMRPAHARLTAIYSRQENASDAAEFYRQHLTREPGAAWAHVGLAEILLQQQKQEEALQHSRIAVELAPESGLAHLALGKVLHAIKELKLALHHLQVAVQQEPDSADAHYLLGTALFDIGKRDLAEFHFNQAIRANPNDFRSENNLGLLMESQGQFSEAADHFRRGIRIKPDDPLLHFNLGRMLTVNGQSSEAVKCFREALRLNPNFEIASQYLQRELRRK